MKEKKVIGGVEFKIIPGNYGYVGHLSVTDDVITVMNAAYRYLEDKGYYRANVRILDSVRKQCLDINHIITVNRKKLKYGAVNYSNMMIAILEGFESPTVVESVAFHHFDKKCGVFEFLRQEHK